MEICSVLHHSSKDIIAKLFAVGVDTKIWGCWWDALIWNEPITTGKGFCREYHGIPHFLGGKTKIDANHILIDCGDDEDLFFWTIENKTDAYMWAYRIQGYEEKSKKRKEQEKERQRKFEEKIYGHNIGYMSEVHRKQADRIKQKNDAEINKLMKALDEKTEIKIDNTTIKL